MPTIHREAGFRFSIYFDDHEPAHVHAWKSGAVARIRIGDAATRPMVFEAGVMTTAMLRRAKRIVEANQEQFLVAWRKINGA